jgi:tetratricopeptide (TPR) repeat protein
MRRKLYIVYCLFAPVLYCLSQENLVDTLVRPEEIRYSNDYEKLQFDRFFIHNETDFLRLFLASAATMNESTAISCEQAFRTFLADLGQKAPPSKSPQKRIKTIYRQTHNHFFKQYELNTAFPDIFNNGNFNCVTASALYGIMLQSSNIPFVVHETPVHVYLVAYPEKESIKIESTDPLLGYLNFDQRFKKQYVDYLHDKKLISEKEFSTISTDNLFNKYYFTDRVVMLKELLGIQYINNAIGFFNERKLEKGYHEMEKAYLFYPCEKVKFIMLTALVEILGKENYDKLSDLEYFIRITRYPDDVITAEDIRSEFVKITNYHLISQSNAVYYDRIYEYLKENIRYEKYKKDISFIYFYEKGRFMLNRSRIKEALPLLEEAYKINPDNADAQVALVTALTNSVRFLDIKEAAGIIDQYHIRYADLKTNIAFNNLLALLYLGMAFDCFEDRNISLGDEYLLKFEKLIKEELCGDLPLDAVANAYSSGGIYYFRKGNYTKAKEYIYRGLKVSPNNPKLLYCLTSFD